MKVRRLPDRIRPNLPDDQAWLLVDDVPLQTMEFVRRFLAADATIDYIDPGSWILVV